jgi:hypothetical protein
MRKVRLFDGPPTRLRLSLPDALFRDTPIEDVPDADLTPVTAAAAASRDLAGTLAGKLPGDPIRSEDWNSVVGAVGDLAAAVVQLTALVSPRGHDHPEIEEKLDEVNANVRTFSDSFGRQLAQMQRTLQALATRREVEDVLAQAKEVAAEQRKRIEAALVELEREIGRDVIPYGKTKKRAYQAVLDGIIAVQEGQRDPAVADALANADSYRYLLGLATEEAMSSQPRSIVGEVAHHDRVNQKTGGTMYTKALGR